MVVVTVILEAVVSGGSGCGHGDIYTGSGGCDGGNNDSTCSSSSSSSSSSSIYCCYNTNLQDVIKTKQMRMNSLSNLIAVRSNNYPKIRSFLISNYYKTN